jgi:hypothetical protein
MNSWDEGKYAGANHPALDEFLSGKESKPLRTLARGGALETKILPSGTRVQFGKSDAFSALLAYAEPPAAGEHGTVVKVRTAAGDTTESEGLVFVRWDSGRFFPVYRRHVARTGHRTATSGAYRRVLRGGLGNLSEFLRVGAEELVHKATQDLWSLTKQGDDYVIERLFDGSGEPLKL